MFIVLWPSSPGKRSLWTAIAEGYPEHSSEQCVIHRTPHIHSSWGWHWPSPHITPIQPLTIRLCTAIPDTTDPSPTYRRFHNYTEHWTRWRSIQLGGNIVLCSRPWRGGRGAHFNCDTSGLGSKFSVYIGHYRLVAFPRWWWWWHYTSSSEMKGRGEGGVRGNVKAFCWMSGRGWPCFVSDAVAASWFSIV